MQRAVTVHQVCVARYELMVKASSNRCRVASARAAANHNAAASSIYASPWLQHFMHTQVMHAAAWAQSSAPIYSFCFVHSSQRRKYTCSSLLEHQKMSAQPTPMASGRPSSSSLSRHQVDLLAASNAFLTNHDNLSAFHNASYHNSCLLLFRWSSSVNLQAGIQIMLRAARSGVDAVNAN